jgi:hypothetical protein
MYIQINPEYILAYFERPVEISRFIRITWYKKMKQLRIKQFAHSTA